VMADGGSPLGVATFSSIDRFDRPHPPADTMSGNTIVKLTILLPILKITLKYLTTDGNASYLQRITNVRVTDAYK